MPQYLIERQLPANTNLSQRELIAVATKSRRVLEDLGPDIRWHHTYYLGERFYCVYSAPNEELIREHGSRGGFPVTNISEVRTILDVSWAERPDAEGAEPRKAA